MSVLTFAIAASQTGRPLDPAVLELFDARAAAEVPFPSDRSVTWTNAAGTIWFSGWQARGRANPQELRWHVDPNGLTAFAGRVWRRRDGWSGTASVASALAHHLERQPLVGSADALAGVYVVASLARHGPSAVAADRLGVAPLHWGQSPDVAVLSTRAAVAAALLAAAQGTSPQRDVFTTGWLAYAGQMMGARTAYEQISLVPEGSVVEIEQTGAIQLHRSSRPPWRLHAQELASDPHAALDEVRAEMTTAIRTALRSPGTEGCVGLTGGKDSRLILALLLADGSAADFEYQTRGDDDLPDVVVARQLAESFGLQHVINPSVGDRWAWRMRVDEAVRDNGLGHAHTREIGFRITAWATSGTRNVGEPHLGRLPSGGTVLLSGLCGEALRTNYHHSTKLHSKEQAARFPDHVNFGAAGILRRDALARYRAEIHELLFGGAIDEDSPQDVIDSFYLRHRLRRWLGPTQEVDSEDRVFPLYSITAIRLAFAIGAENRHAEWIHYQLMGAAYEPLVHLPFAAGDWLPGANDELVPPQRYDDPIPPAPPRPRPRDLVHDRLGSLRRRVARQPPATRNVAWEYRAKVRSTDVEIMRRLFRHDAANPAFDLIDATAAQRALDAFDTLAESQRLQLYGALSAVIWLGGHEVELPRDLSTD
jgi:hypothetical protein